MSNNSPLPNPSDNRSATASSTSIDKQPSILRYPQCILAACCIPWNADNSISEAIFRRSVQNLLKNLSRHLYVFGTAGEGYAVTRGQFERVCHVFHEEMSENDSHPMVGVISLSQMEVMERIEWSRNRGFRSFQISLPSWGALTEAETRRYFRDVCGAFPDCDFLHYNLMRTKRLVTAQEYAILAAENPNLVATKNSTGDAERITELLRCAPTLTHFFTESGYATGSLIGPCGFLVSIASCNFAKARCFFEAGFHRDRDQLLEMQQELNAIIVDLISTAHNEAHMDGAYDKAFCRLHDQDYPLRLLPPYETLSDKTFISFRDLLLSKYPLWSPAKILLSGPEVSSPAPENHS